MDIKNVVRILSLTAMIVLYATTMHFWSTAGKLKDENIRLKYAITQKDSIINLDSQKHQQYEHLVDKNNAYCAKCTTKLECSYIGNVMQCYCTKCKKMTKYNLDLLE